VIDTHIHLQHQRYQDDLDDVIGRAAVAGVTAMIVPGTDLESSAAAVALADRPMSSQPCEIYAAVGIHPTSAHLLTDAALETLRDLAHHPRVVAIGEIGLDYYWPQVEDRGWHCPDPAVQRLALKRQLALANELALPVILHDRDAHQDLLRILTDWRAQEDQASAPLRGTLHAYAGGTVHLAEVLALGFYIGMDGPVTFKNAATLHAIARQVALDRLLLETDGPYLTPRPYRGQRNEPAYLKYIAEKIANLRELSLDALGDATTQNARELFGI
jgi:TatD DNase family protein